MHKKAIYYEDSEMKQSWDAERKEVTPAIQKVTSDKILKITYYG